MLCRHAPTQLRQTGPATTSQTARQWQPLYRCPQRSASVPSHAPLRLSGVSNCACSQRLRKPLRALGNLSLPQAMDAVAVAEATRVRKGLWGSRGHDVMPKRRVTLFDGDGCWHAQPPPAPKPHAAVCPCYCSRQGRGFRACMPRTWPNGCRYPYATWRAHGMCLLRVQLGVHPCMHACPIRPHRLAASEAQGALQARPQAARLGVHAAPSPG